MDFQQDQEQLASVAWKPRKPIALGGLLKYMHGQEYHAFNPDVVAKLQYAVASGEYGHYKEYAALVNERPVTTLRDLFGFREGLEAIGISEVEPVEQIFPDSTPQPCPWALCHRRLTSRWLLL